QDDRNPRLFAVILIQALFQHCLGLRQRQTPHVHSGQKPEINFSIRPNDAGGKRVGVIHQFHFQAVARAQRKLPCRRLEPGRINAVCEGGHFQFRGNTGAWLKGIEPRPRMLATGEEQRREKAKEEREQATISGAGFHGLVKIGWVMSGPMFLPVHSAVTDWMNAVIPASSKSSTWMNGRLLT